MGLKYCVSCGKENMEAMRRCPVCGSMVFSTSPQHKPSKHGQLQPKIANFEIKAPDNSQVITSSVLTKSRAGYLLRHWRGELSLPTSYWLNSYALAAILTVALFALSSADISLYPKTIASLQIAYWIIVAISQIWLTVGIIRSARVYSKCYPKRGWGAAASFFAVLGALSAASVFVQQGIPQISGMADIISTATQEKLYTTRLLRNLTEIELSGPLDFGVSKELETMLHDYPTVKILHLNSPGGRLAEAAKLRDLVLAHNLDTYVATECDSACVTVFIAGNNRLLSKTAKIGLHEAYFPGLDESTLAATNIETKQFFYSRGIGADVIEKGFSTKHSDIWYPDHTQLFSSRIATAYASDDSVGLSGMGPSNIDEGMSSIAQLPLFSAIKEKFPTEYPRIDAMLRDGLLRGKSVQELRGELLPLLAVYYTKSIPTASLGAIENFFNVIAAEAEAFQQVSGTKCVAYIKGETNGFSMSEIAAEYNTRDVEAGTEVILTSGSYRGPKITDEEAQEFLLKVMSKAGEKLGLSAEDFSKGINYELDPTMTCKVYISYFSGLTDIPEDEKPILLRYVAQSMGP